GNKVSMRSLSSAMRRLSVWVKAPICRFSSTVRREKMRRPSGPCTTPMAAMSCGRTSAGRSPLKRVLPARGCGKPLVGGGGRGLAGAVGHHQGHDLALLDRDRDALQRLDVVVEDVNVVDLEKRHRASLSSNRQVMPPAVGFAAARAARWRTLGGDPEELPR